MIARPVVGRESARARASRLPAASRRWLLANWSGGTPRRASTPNRPATIRCWNVRRATKRRRSRYWSGRSTRGTRKASGPRVEVVGVSGPWQNLAMTRGLEATNGYNPAAHRLVRPPRFAGRDHPHRRPTPVSRVVRRLRLRAGPRAGPGVRGARAADRAGSASGATPGVGHPAGRAQGSGSTGSPIPSRG